jgi:hypothetical protein
MQLKHWGARLALGLIFIAGALACRTSDIFLAQATTVPTRTPRPTFTPLPPPTDTPEPTATIPPSPSPKPAVRPTVRATARPATPVPPPPPAAPTTPPQPQFQYAANPASCTHAGNQYIKGRVYDSSDPSANGVAGLMMALGGADGNNAYVTTPNEYDGVYTFTLTPEGGAANAGTYYVWILDGSGKRISDVGGPINFNLAGPDASNSCWAGSVDFWRH